MGKLKEYLEFTSPYFKSLTPEEQDKIIEKFNQNPELADEYLAQTSKFYASLPQEKRNEILKEMVDVPLGEKVKELGREFLKGSGEAVKDVGRIIQKGVKLTEPIEKPIETLLFRTTKPTEVKKQIGKTLEQVGQEAQQYWTQPYDKLYEIPLVTGMVEQTPSVIMSSPLMGVGAKVGGTIGSGLVNKLATRLAAGAGYSAFKYAADEYKGKDVLAQATIDMLFGAGEHFLGSLLAKVKIPVEPKINKLLSQNVVKRITSLFKRGKPIAIEDIASQVERAAKQLGREDIAKAVKQITPEQWQETIKEITQKVREKQPPKILEDKIDDISDIRPEIPDEKSKIKANIERLALNKIGKRKPYADWVRRHERNKEVLEGKLIEYFTEDPNELAWLQGTDKPKPPSINTIVKLIKRQNRLAEEGVKILGEPDYSVANGIEILRETAMPGDKLNKLLQALKDEGIEIPVDESEWRGYVKGITRKIREKQPIKTEETIDEISDIRPKPTPKEKIKKQVEKALKEEMKNAEQVQKAGEVYESVPKSEVPKEGEMPAVEGGKRVRGGGQEVKAEEKIKEPWEMTREELGQSGFIITTPDMILSNKPPEWWKWLKIKRPRSNYITVYRGVSKERGTFAKEIKPGDWVTLDKKYAARYGDVISKRVPLDELVEASTNSPNSIELFYVPKEKQIDSHYKIIKQALKEGKPVPPEVLKDYPDLAEKYGKRAEVVGVKEQPKEIIEQKPAETKGGVIQFDKIENVLGRKKRTDKTPKFQAKIIYRVEGKPITVDIDIRKKISTIRIQGNTFPIKDNLKQIGFKWDWYSKTWNKTIEFDNLAQEMNQLEEAGFSKISKIIEKLKGDVEQDIKYSPLKEPQENVSQFLKRHSIEFHAGIPPKVAIKSLADILQKEGEKARAKGNHVIADKMFKLADKLGAGKEVETIKDISPLLKDFYFPERLAEKYKKIYPEIDRIVKTNLEREQVAHKYVNRFNKLIFDRIEKLPEPEKEKLFNLLYQESYLGKSIKKVDLSPEGKRLYHTIRRELRKVWDDYRNELRETILKAIDGKIKNKELNETFSRAVLENRPDIVKKYAKEYPELVQMINDLANMGGVPFYMPQKRLGEYLVHVYDPEGDFRFTADFKTRSEAEAFKKKLQANPEAIKEWFKKIGEELPPDIDFAKLQIKAEQVSKPLHQWREDVNFPKVAGLLEALAQQKGDKGALYHSMAQDMIEWMKSMGWSSHTLRRKNIPGFSLNPERNIEMLKSYLYGYAFAKTKKKAAEQQWKDFFSLAMRRHAPKEIVNYLKDYLSKTHGSPDSPAVREATKLISSWYLAFKPLSVVVNSFQNITTGMAAYIRHGIKPTRLIDAWLKIFAKKKMSYTEKKAIVKAIEEGELSAQILKEQLDKWKLEHFKKGKIGLDEIIDIGLYPFSFVESYVNRMAHFLGAFNHFRSKGLKFEEAYKKAIDVMHEGHYWASRYNKMPLQDKNEIMKVATALQTFTFHYFDQLVHYWHVDKKAFAYLIASPLILGGLVAIPGGDFIIEHVIKPLYRKYTGRQLDWDLAKDNTGYFIRYGLFAPISPSLSRSIGVGFSEDPSKMLGGVLQGIIKQLERSYEMFERGDTAKAITELMPPALRNIFRAILFKKRGGVETVKGVKLRDKYGRVIKPEGKDFLMLMLGFQPPEYQKIWDKRKAAYNAQKIRNEALKRIITLYRNGQIKEAKRLRDKWNERAKQGYRKAKDNLEKLYWRGMFIDNRSLIAALKGYERDMFGVKKEFGAILRR